MCTYGNVGAGENCCVTHQHAAELPGIPSAQRLTCAVHPAEVFLIFMHHSVDVLKLIKKKKKAEEEKMSALSLCILKLLENRQKKRSISAVGRYCTSGPRKDALVFNHGYLGKASRN